MSRVRCDAWINLFEAFGIKTTGLEEKASACSMLVCYAKELKEGFVNYVEETTKLMVPLLRFYFHEGKQISVSPNRTDDLPFCTGVRAAAAESLPYLLDCAKLRGDDYVRQMWQYMNKELFKAIEIEPDHEVLGELFSSLGKVRARRRTKKWNVWLCAVLVYRSVGRLVFNC